MIRRARATILALAVGGLLAVGDHAHAQDSVVVDFRVEVDGRLRAVQLDAGRNPDFDLVLVGDCSGRVR